MWLQQFPRRLHRSVSKLHNTADKASPKWFISVIPFREETELLLYFLLTLFQLVLGSFENKPLPVVNNGDKGKHSAGSNHKPN